LTKIKEEMKSRFLILMVMLVWNGITMAQVQLEGRVTDRNSGSGISGAHVQLDGTMRTTFTDASGKFTFQQVAEGIRVIRISHISYETIFDTIWIAKKPLSLDYRLDPAYHLSEEFVVKAVRTDEQIKGSSTLIKKEALKETNLGQDLPILLSFAPSVVATSDAGAGVGYTGMRIRGIDQNRINVTINGVPLNDAESHSVYWVDLPDFASSAEDIQIQRGVGTSSNGAGAFGSSVNILTGKLQTSPYAGSSNSIGSFNTYRNNIDFGTGLLKNHFSFDGRASMIRSDGYIDRAWSDLSSICLSGGWYGKRTVLKGIMMTGHEVTYQAWGGTPSEILDTNRTYNPMGLYTDTSGCISSYPNQVDDYRQTHYQLHLVQQLPRGVTGSLTLFLTTGSGFYEEYKESEKLKDYGLPKVICGTDTFEKSDLIRQKWLDNRFYGVNWSLRKEISKGALTIGGSVSRYDGDHFGKLLWLRHQGYVEKDHEWYRGTGDKDDYNFFAKCTYMPGKKVILFADLQYRFINYEITGIDNDLRDIGRHETYPFFNPKMGISYRHSDRQESWLMLGIANREPNRSNFTDAKPGEPVPAAERLYDLEAGHKMSGDKWTLEGNGYVMYYKDQLVMTGEINDIGDPVMTNVDSSYRMGIEISGAFRILPQLFWEGSLTLSRNRILHFTEHVDDWDTWEQREGYLGMTDLSFSPSIIASNSLRITPLNGVSLTLVSQYVGKQYLDNTSNPERALAPWLVNHLFIQYRLQTKIFKECRFNLMIINILNEKYESNGWVYSYFENNERKMMNGLYPQAGIHLLGGVTFGF
jgi:iron complex outermembrane recepter protein